mmetsp:Transcript_14835/g.30091  ORF Transcript_14835/g.30091 Transcript_14835/m.30091 type:complete len:302 (+) Transcript_14835:152-1057(+)
MFWFEIQNTTIGCALSRLALPTLLALDLEPRSLLLCSFSFDTRLVSPRAFRQAAFACRLGLQLHSTALLATHFHIGAPPFVPAGAAGIGLGHTSRTGPARVESDLAEFLVHVTDCLLRDPTPWKPSGVHRLGHALCLLHDDLLRADASHEILLLLVQLLISTIHDVLLLLLPLTLLLFFLGLNFGQTLINVLVDEVRNVLPIENLGDNVVLPVRILQHVILASVMLIHARAASSLLKVPFCRGFLDLHGASVCLVGTLRENALWDRCATDLLITWNGPLHREAVQDALGTCAAEFAVYPRF